MLVLIAVIDLVRDVVLVVVVAVVITLTGIVTYLVVVALLLATAKGDFCRQFTFEILTLELIMIIMTCLETNSKKTVFCITL